MPTPETNAVEPSIYEGLHSQRSEEDLIPAPVEMGGVYLRPSETLSDTIDRIRTLEGEDPYSGIVPITEDAIAIELEASRDDEDEAPVIAYSLWSEEDRKRLLSRIPIEALHALFTRWYGTRWWKHETEVLMEDLLGTGIILDVGGIYKLRAFHTILRAPIGQCPFYTDPGAFLFLCVSLSGRPSLFETHSWPSALEMAIAIHVLQGIRPGIFEDDVLGS